MILLIAIIFLVVFSNSFLLDPDLGWHLSLGKEIVDKHSFVTHFDGYNYFADLSRIDHEWLSNVLFYEINKYLGYPGLMLFFGIILFATVWLLYKILNKTLRSRSAALFLLFFTMLPFLSNYGIRVQFILVFGLVLLLYIKNFISSVTKRSLFYFFIVLVINNLHGGFITLVPAILLLELDIFRQKVPVKIRVQQYLSISIALIVPLFLNPLGIEYIRLLLSYGNGTYQDYIAEWAPIYSFPIVFNIIPLIIPLSVFVFTLTFNKFFSKLYWNEIILLLIYGYLGIAHVRQFPILIVSAAPIAAKAILDLRTVLKTNKSLRSFSILYVGIITLILLTYRCNLFSSVFVPHKWQEGFSTNNGYPIAATAYISHNHPVSGNFLNPYDWGGFISWTHPELHIFIDGRGPEKLIDDKTSIIQEDMNFFSTDKSKIENKLQQYDISYILVQKPRGLDRFDSYLLSVFGGKNLVSIYNENNLEKYLESNPSWQNVYEDEISQVFFLKK